MAVRYNRCLTGRRPRDNHVVRFGQSAENRESACKGGEALAPPGSWKKIWDKKKSPLWVYVSPSISQLTTNCGPLLRIKWEIYFYIEKCFVRSLNCVLSLWLYNNGTQTSNVTPGECGPGNNGNKGVPISLKTPGLATHYQMHFSVLFRNF